MVSIDKISDKFEQLDEYLRILEIARQADLVSFLNDKILVGGVKYYLQISIECCLDIANHIIAAEGFRAPKDYADSFKVLEESGVVSEKLGTKLRQMAKFRNRLVHLYGEIDDGFVHTFVNHDIRDILEFKRVIADRFIIAL